MVEAEHPLNPKVFTLHGVTYTWTDVITLAELTGAADPVRQRILTGMRLLDWGGRQGREVPEDLFQGMVDEIRYARDLVTVEETERWLQSHALSLEDLSDAAERRAAEAAWALEAPVEPPFSAPRQVVLSLYWPETLFDGAWRSWLEALARRAACAPDGWTGVLTAGGHAPATTASTIAVQPLAEAVAARAVGMQMLEFEYAERRAEACGRACLERTLELQRLPLTLLVYEMAAFANHDAAAEAVLCMREDAVDMAEIARTIEASHGQREQLLDDMPRALGEALLSAEPGDVLDPVERNGRWVVLRLLEKRLPGLEDDRVRERVRAAAENAAFLEAIHQGMTWHVPLV